MGSSINGIYVPDVGESGWGPNVSNNMRRLADLGVNVNAYGTNLTAAQSAIDALPVNGGLVVVPAGTFSGSTGLTGTKRRVTIRGAGKGNTILNYTGSGTALAWGSSGTPVAEMQFVLEDLTIQLTDTAAVGLDLIRFQDFALKNVEVLGPGTGGTSIGLRVRGANSGTAINTNVQSFNTGIKFMTETDGANLHTFIGGGLLSNARAILATASAITFVGTNIASTSTAPAALIQQGTNPQFLKCFFEGNATGANSASIELGTVTGGDVVNGALIEGCHFTEINVIYGVRTVRGSGTKVFSNWNGSTGMTALARAETNAAAIQVWGNDNTNAAGVPHISDGSSSVDAFGIGPGTNFDKIAAGYRFGSKVILNATSSGADQLTIPDTTAGAGLTIGGDTQLFRAGADVLGTNDNFKQQGAGTYHEMLENGTADAAAGGVNTGRLYVRDNGAGKSQLCVRFNTGAVQVIATEP